MQQRHIARLQAVEAGQAAGHALLLVLAKQAQPRRPICFVLFGSVSRGRLFVDNTAVLTSKTIYDASRLVIGEPIYL